MPNKPSKSKIVHEPVQARSRERVERILAAARKVLERDGLEGFSSTAIAREAGVPVGSFYQFFPNREAILVLFYEEYLGFIRAEIEAFETPENIALSWQEFAAAFVAHMRRQEFTTPYILQLYLAIEREPSLRELEQQQMELVADFIVRHMKRYGVRKDEASLRRAGMFLYEFNNALWSFATRAGEEYFDDEALRWQTKTALSVLGELFED